ncbi:MAG: SCO family protein, partial [Marinirhabdus sp.]
MKKQNYTYIGVSFIILLFGIWAVPKIVSKFSKPDLATIGAVPQFRFTDQNGETVTNKTYEGKIYIAEFFFTTCPSICPIMNKNMVKVQNEFYGNPNIGFASFTIDPAYDTPSVLKQYAKAYGIVNPNWHLLTGPK